MHTNINANQARGQHDYNNIFLGNFCSFHLTKMKRNELGLRT
jgi:hypothetical protein